MFDIGPLEVLIWLAAAFVLFVRPLGIAVLLYIALQAITRAPRAGR